MDDNGAGISNRRCRVTNKSGCLFEAIELNATLEGDRIMRIDAHQHFWKLSRGDYSWLTPDKTALYRDYLPANLKPLLDETSIDGTIIVQAADTTEETRYLLSLAESHSWILGVVGWVDMESPQSIGLLEELSLHPKFLGIRPMIQNIADDKWMLKPSLAPVFEQLQTLDLRFDALILPRHVKYLHELLKRYPKLKCVINHGAKPDIHGEDYDGWANDIAHLAGDTNCFCKLSGLATKAALINGGDALYPCMNHLLYIFGANRLMFGSDWPVVNNTCDYKAWHDQVLSFSKQFSTEDQLAIFGNTATKFYL
ncbi:MAG: amidohydrolase family protein [Cocleimonas sp.]